MPHTWLPAKWSHALHFGSARFLADDGRHFGTLDFQDGAVLDHGVNGVTNEEVLQALIERLEALNTQPYQCTENELAIRHLHQALKALELRTANRRARGVEGTSRV